MAYLLSDAKQFLLDNNWQDSSGPGLRKLIKICNDANSALHRTGKYDFDRRFASLQFNAPKSAGTVTLTNGSAVVTGATTAFAAADIGSFIRASGEPQTYRFSNVSSATAATLATTVPAGYLGTTGGGKSYVLSNPRVALPTRFRCMERNVIEDGTWRLSPENDLSNLKRWRRWERGSGTPRAYSFEWEPGSADTIKVPYLWVYPDPSIQIVIEVPYFEWPKAVAVDGDDFGVPDIEAIYEALRHFQLAYLYRENRDFNAYNQQLNVAVSAARESLAEFRTGTENNQRSEYCDDDTTYLYRIQAGPGVEDA